MTLPVIGERDDLVPGLVVVPLGEILEQLALAIGLPVLEITQDERRVGDAERLVGRRGEADAGVDDIDDAETESLVELFLGAELRRWEYLDVIFAVGALPDLAGRPQRFNVIGLADLVAMGPFQFGLGASRSRDGRSDEKSRR